MHKPVVLLVDDDRDNLELVSLYLNHAGYVVITADSEEAAYAACDKAERIDALITDFSLKGEWDRNGVDVLACMSKTPSVAIMISGHVMDVEAAGFDALLNKPFLPAELCDALAEYLSEEYQNALYGVAKAG